MKNREIKSTVWHNFDLKLLNMDGGYIKNNKACFFDDDGACGDPECCGKIYPMNDESVETLCYKGNIYENPKLINKTRDIKAKMGQSMVNPCNLVL